MPSTGPKGSGLTPSQIDELRIKHGLSQNQIAELSGTTRQNVSQIKRRAKHYRSPREIALQHFPWKVPAQFNGAPPYRRMRDHAEYMATGGKGMSRLKLVKLINFYNQLDDGNFVVEYDPALPPTEGNKRGGFRLVKREDSDGDLIIRVNEHTTLTPEGRVLWRMPPTRPTVSE